MALADYLQRNAQAAAVLVQGFDPSLLAARLDKEVIGVVYDNSVHTSQEAQASLDLTVRLLARLYPTLVIAGLLGTKAAYLSKLQRLARAINPKIDIASDIGTATKQLVFGRNRVAVRGKARQYTWYVGSDNWVARVSKSAPVGSGNTANPLAAGAAACIAAANVFRAVFVQELGQAALDSEVAVSLIDIRPVGPQTINPPLAEVELQDVHLAGAGAIGSGVLWALSRMPCRGTLHVIDPEKVTDSNLQRYVMLTAADKDKEKATLAVEWLKSRRRLTVKPHVSAWAEHVEVVPEYKVDTVLSAVDSAKARIQIQASLPRLIFNGWTQRGEAGVSRHRFLDTMACLACLYIPTGQAVNEDVLVVRALRLPEVEATIQEVRRRLQKSVPTDAQFLQQIATAAGLSPEKLAAFENRPLRDLYVEGVCGGQVMEFHQAAIQVKAEVPMGFQSTLSGLLLVAELARPSALTDTITQIDLLGTFPDRPGHVKGKTKSPPCLCQDEDFIEVFKEKYGAEAST
jgi:hypothetical protein